MITKAKKLTYTTSDGRSFDSIEEVKKHELIALCEVATGNDSDNIILSRIVAKPREAIAILKFGLPRKPRTPKPPMGRKPRRKIKQDMPDPFDNAPRVRTANEIAKGQ